MATLNGKEFAASVGRSADWVYAKKTEHLPYHMPRRKYHRYRFTPGDVGAWLDSAHSTGSALRDSRVDAQEHLSSVALNHDFDSLAIAIQTIAEALSALDMRSRLVICCRYGIHCQPMTLEQAGKVIGVSRGRLAQIECKALARMRAEVAKNKDHWEDFIGRVGWTWHYRPALMRYEKKLTADRARSKKEDRERRSALRAKLTRLRGGRCDT